MIKTMNPLAIAVGAAALVAGAFGLLRCRSKRDRLAFVHDELAYHHWLS